MVPRRRKIKSDAELEKVTGIRRTEPRRWATADVRKLELKILGRDWGKPRRKMTGWPK